MLQAHPEINVIFCGHGNPATGALAATRNVGRDQDGPNKVYVVAWAIDVPILQGVEKGDFGMTVAQNPYMMGVQSMLELWSANADEAHDDPAKTAVRAANQAERQRLTVTANPPYLRPPSLRVARLNGR
jgi:ABC-type sugar transport system substrate-binding protein